MKFSTIMADPPWMYSYETRKTETPGTGWLGAGERHYPTMKFADIKALPVPGLAADNAVLWLWIVNPLMARGFELLEHWGFTYKGMVTWAKTQNDWVTPFVGCGYWLRGATEHMLLGVKGQVKPLVKVQPTWFSAPVTEHSEKPEHSYRVAERYWYEPRLEMFARRKRPGWSVWGNEVESDIVMPTGT